MALLKRTSPVEKAFAAHAQAVETVARWESEQAARRAELGDLEARIGAEVLEDETAADRLAEQAAKLRSQIDVAGRTAAAASDRVVEAGRAVLRAYSAELKANADHIASEVEQREVKTRKLLADLEEWEGGCKYVAWEPTSGEVFAAGSVAYKIPKTEALHNQAKSLAAKAAQYEQHADGTREQVAAQVARLAGQIQTPAPVTVAG